MAWTEITHRQYVRSRQRLRAPAQTLGPGSGPGPNARLPGSGATADRACGKVNSGKFGLTCIDAQDNAGEPVALREDVITAELLDADVYANAGERMPQVVNSYA